jgi:hypothetical protein
MRISFTLLFVASLGWSQSAAQPQASTGPSVSAMFSSSADSDLTRAGAPAGEVGVSALAATWRSTAALSSTTRLSYGLSWERFDFDRAACRGKTPNPARTSSSHR